MALELHYGDVTLRDTLSLGPDSLQIENRWKVLEEDAVRSPQGYARGNGNAVQVVRFRLLARHATRFNQINFRRRLFSEIYGTDIKTPRELWYVDTAESAIPLSFGLAIAQPPRVVDGGKDETGYITFVEYEFLCNVLPLGSTSSTPIEAEPVTVAVPSLFLPNAHGIVLRRTTDGNYVKIAYDFTLKGFAFTDLGAIAPSATNYQSQTADCEWSDASSGIGLYIENNFRLIKLTDQLNFSFTAGTSAEDFSSTYTLTKGLVFATGTGPVARTPDNRRYRWTLGGLNQIILVPL